MTNEPPAVNPTGIYTATEAIRLLGVSSAKFYRDIKKGSKCGGVDARPRRDNGRLQFTGRELLRYWRG